MSEFVTTSESRIVTAHGIFNNIMFLRTIHVMKQMLFHKVFMMNITRIMLSIERQAKFCRSLNG